jgi:hypothetical protein
MRMALCDRKVVGAFQRTVLVGPEPMATSAATAGTFAEPPLEAPPRSLFASLVIKGVAKMPYEKQTSSTLDSSTY